MSILELIVERIELPESAYDKAKMRYQNLGEWLCRADSEVFRYSPAIFPQGSFRLGTANHPLNTNDLYDLDLSCSLQIGFDINKKTQKELKELIGREVESYRKSQSIIEPLEEKHRCWRLNYRDQLGFHLDIVPSLPASVHTQQKILERMTQFGEALDISNEVSKLSQFITDNRRADYNEISDDWKISNSEGYAKWFEQRMNQRLSLYETRDVALLPIYKQKSILQKLVQLLKRHRDVMFKNNVDLKPVSIMLTTLAARAFEGETDLENAIENVLGKMGALVSLTVPRVPNPVNPSEDFTDRWTMPEYSHLNLEKNFHLWLAQAKSDFDNLRYTNEIANLKEQLNRKFQIEISNDELGRQASQFSGSQSNFKPELHQISDPPRPWKIN